MELSWLSWALDISGTREGPENSFDWIDSFASELKRREAAAPVGAKVCCLFIPKSLISSRVSLLTPLDLDLLLAAGFIFL